MQSRTWFRLGLLLVAGLSTAAWAQKERELEVPDDPYIAVDPAKQQTSPAMHGVLDTYVAIQVNVDPNGRNIIGDAANEPSLSIDPTNRRHMVIGWRQFDTVQSNFRQAGWGYTTDGGQTWHFTGRLAPGVFRSDPVLDTDSTGNFYYNSLTSDSIYHTYVHKSTDGGQTWTAGVNAWGGDKQWMVIDKTGGGGNNNIYSFWTSWYSSCSGDFTRSRDLGATFETCMSIPSVPSWGAMAIGPTGELYIVGDGLQVCKSTDVQGPGTPTWTNVNLTSLSNGVQYGLPPNPDGLAGQAWIAVDSSNNATRGNVYVLCSTPYGGNQLDVMFTRSTNGGSTWSTPLRVNDDANPGTHWHWFGTLSIAPNGRLDVIWNDSRNSPGSVNSQVFYSYSENGGQTWSPNVALTSTFNPLIGWPRQNKIGDYYQMISYNSGAHLAFSATFNNEQDVYYMYIPRYPTGDMNCDGVVNFDDINPFVQALADPAGYATSHPNCDVVLGDINNDGQVSFDDINPFVALLSH